mgnify:CR=1 FL=1
MKQKLLVSQIQNFSLHDGPGIRTTVFYRDVICDANGVTTRRHRSTVSSLCGIRKNVQDAGSVPRPVPAALFLWRGQDR